MIIREDDGIWIVMKETIAAHHEDVFACFTTSGGLTRWFPVAAEIEPRPGGMLVLGWDEKFKRKSTLAVLDFDPAGTIVWDWFADHHDTHAPVYWKVTPSVEEGSEVEMRQGPFRETIDSLMAMASEASYWRWYLCNLRSTLEVSHDMRRIRPL